MTQTYFFQECSHIVNGIINDHPNALAGVVTLNFFERDFARFPCFTHFRFLLISIFKALQVGKCDSNRNNKLKSGQSLIHNVLIDSCEIEIKFITLK